MPGGTVAEVGQDKWHEIVLVTALSWVLLSFDGGKRAFLRGLLLRYDVLGPHYQVDAH